MRRILLRMLAAGLAALLLVTPVLAAEASPSDGEAVLAALAGYLDVPDAKLLDADKLRAGDSISDWLAFALGRAGCAESASRYLSDLEALVTQRYQTEGGLDGKKATEWHRIGLTVLSLGGDPTAFGHHSDGTPIDLIRDGTYGWTQTDSFDTQGVNAWSFALLTLNAKDFSTPQDAAWPQETLLAHLLSAQTERGGFGLGGGDNVDLTAMALQALAPYRNGEAKDAVDRALAYLAAEQYADGSFGGSAESTAQVIIALCCLEIDPASDARFCQTGGSPVDGLKRFRLPSGMYCHTLGGEADLFATKDVLLAFVALDRLRGGYRSLYDLRPEADGTTVTLYHLSTVPLLWVALPILLAAAIPVLIVIIRKRGKKHYV